ncbi:hypothetical protein QBE55_13225 [Eubacteriales bacterium mix99]|jgi:cell division protein FtsL
MVVAEKYGYLEEMEPIPEPSRKEEPAPKRQSGRRVYPERSIRNKILTIGMVLVCFAVACFAVFRYTLIMNYHDRIAELEDSLDKVYSQQDRLKVELAGGEDLNNIEFKATADLNMQYPESGQVQYVELPKEPGKQEKHVDAEKTGRPGKSIWNRLLGLSN